MRYLNSTCLFWMFILVSCDGHSKEKHPSDVGLEKHDVEIGLIEIDKAVALWYSYQDEAFVAVRPLVAKNFGAINNKRDPLEIISSQRYVLNVLTSKVGINNAEAESILKRWSDCQIEAATCLGGVDGSNAEEVKKMSLVRLLDFQHGKLELIKNERQRRREMSPRDKH